MESLVASYASSDEEDEQQLENEKFSNPSQLLSSLPPPKSQSKDVPSSLFSILPPPKTTLTDLSGPKPKRVVQFRPPLNPFSAKSNSIDDEEDDEKEKKRKKSESVTHAPSVKSFLSSIPAPKNSTSLGVLGSASAGRRSSTIDAHVPVPDSHVSTSQNDVVVHSNTWYGDQSQQVDGSLQGLMGGVDTGDYANWAAQGYVNNEGYANDGATDYAGNYGTYTGYEQYGNNNWTDGGSSATAASEITETAEVALRLPGKRARKDTPPQIIEVSQDELMKNRPREDQARLTGIAFGPSYQPVSSKGKPSKLLKRKHQISTLYFDMKQKEMELTERRAKGMLTKAQTQGKYGW